MIKHHLGYFRFSEDADFTWRDQSGLRDKTGKEARRELSPTTDAVGRILEQISSARGLDFKCSKSDTGYVELGGGGKMCTFKIWYHSVVLKKRLFIKIQINFIEEVCTKPKRGQLRSLAAGNDEELKALFAEYLEYSKTVTLDLYDAKEILSEKIRGTRSPSFDVF